VSYYLEFTALFIDITWVVDGSMSIYQRTKEADLSL